MAVESDINVHHQRSAWLEYKVLILNAIFPVITCGDIVERVSAEGGCCSVEYHIDRNAVKWNTRLKPQSSIPRVTSVALQVIAKHSWAWRHFPLTLNPINENSEGNQTQTDEL